MDAGNGPRKQNRVCNNPRDFLELCELDITCPFSSFKFRETDDLMANPNNHLSTTTLSTGAVAELENLSKQIKDDELSNVLTARLPGNPSATLNVWNKKGLADEIMQILQQLRYSKKNMPIVYELKGVIGFYQVSAGKPAELLLIDGQIEIPPHSGYNATKLEVHIAIRITQEVVLKGNGRFVAIPVL